MSNPRRQKQLQVKKKIAEILKSVKDEKQHIEIQLTKNDFKIKHLLEQYETLRQESNYEQLTNNETIILQSIVQGLEESNVNPVDIFGVQVAKLTQHHEGMGELTNDEIIEIQETIMKNLWDQIRKAEDPSKDLMNIVKK